MSKPRDPVLAVLKYFETVELPLAQQALALAGAIVKRRSPLAAKRSAAKKTRVTEQPTALTN